MVTQVSHKLLDGFLIKKQLALLLVLVVYKAQTFSSRGKDVNVDLVKTKNIARAISLSGVSK